jgi:rhamnosyltransferase
MAEARSCFVLGIWEEYEVAEVTRAGAVVVTYHPDDDVMENLRVLREQVEPIAVVDNGSNAQQLAALRAAAVAVGFELLENGENLGIAQALNRGVRRIRDLGCTSVFLFDQDSTITPGFVETMASCFRASPSTQTLAILVPRYIDRRFGSVLEPPAGGDGHLEAATTSGSLTPIKVFERAGFFAEELFIDGVDYEYSLRVRRLGFTIDECREAVLLHSPGTPTQHRGLGAKPFQAANYSPIRRYYQERNKIWVAKRYWRTFPGFCAKQFLTSAKDLLKILLVEQDKLRKIRFFFRGLRDGLRNRTGKLEP